jgi:DNA-binding GntR family transcriptional regulator
MAERRSEGNGKAAAGRPRQARPRAPADTDAKRGSHPHYEKLRSILEQAIIKGEYPPGTRLKEQELAKRFNVSRTPVREMLRLLASSGLVDMRARQRAIVATLTIPKLIEMFQVMAELEGLCARLAARRVSPQKLAALDESQAVCARMVAESDPAGFLEANRAFHETLYSASGNQYLEEMTKALRNRVAPYRRYVTYYPGRMAASIPEHAAVLDAIRRGDGETAHRAMREHVNLLGDGFADFISAIPVTEAVAKRSA